MGNCHFGKLPLEKLYNINPTPQFISGDVRDFDRMTIQYNGFCPVALLSGGRIQYNGYCPVALLSGGRIQYNGFCPVALLSGGSSLTFSL